MALVDIIRTLKQICAALLVLVVIIGTMYYDRRFTMLLVPPFLTMYSIEVPDFFMHLPIVIQVRRTYHYMGPTGQKVFLALSGATCACFMFQPEEMTRAFSKILTGK